MTLHLTDADMRMCDRCILASRVPAHEMLECLPVCCLPFVVCRLPPVACQEPFAVTDSTWEFVTQVYYKRCIIKFVLSYLTLLLIHSKILLLIFRFATVAHLAEQHIRNVQVAGSIPASGSTKLRSQHRSFFMVRPAAHVSKGLKSRIRPVAGRR